MRVPGIPYVQGRNDYTDWDSRKYGIAIHNTSNDASDADEASYATRRTDGVSSHLYCDRDSVTQSLDLEDRAGHAGSAEGNDHSLAVEITGANGKSRAWWLANVAWDKLGEALAWIITHDPDYRGFEVRRASVDEMRRNPKVKAFYGHDDMRRAWGGTDHTDPGPSFPWDRLFEAVDQHLQEDDMPTVEDFFEHRFGSPGQGVKPRRFYEWIKVAASAATDTANLLKEAKAAKLRDAAILAAVQGLDQEEILARVDQRADEEVRRDAEARAELVELLNQASIERAEIAELVGQVLSGERDAEAVIQLIARKLTTSNSDDES